LIHWNTARSASEIVHVYLREAKSLRPDRKTLPEISKEAIAAIARNFDMKSLQFDPAGLKK